MVEAGTSVVLEKLDQLRTELADLAFRLECRGRPDAADVAAAVSVRVGELREELAAEDLAVSPPASPCLAGQVRRKNGLDG